MLRKTSISFLVLMLCLSILGGPAFADNSLAKGKLTVNTYEQWLAKEINNAGHEAKIELQKEFAKFNKLSTDDKEKFVRFLNDEKIYKAILTEDVQTGTKTLYGGDVVIGVEQNDEVVQTLAGTQEVKATYKRWVQFLGVNIFETTSWVQYKHDGTKILSIVGSNHFVSRNLNPTLDVDFSGKTEWTTTTRAYSSTDVTFSFIWDGLGLVLGAGNLWVWGDIYNQAGGGVTPY